MYVCHSRQQQYKSAEKKEIWSFLLLLPTFAAKRETLLVWAPMSQI
jgi:hypothetical protein